MLKKLFAFLNGRGYTCQRCKKEIFHFERSCYCEDCENLLWFADDLICPKCGRKTITAGVCLTCKSIPPKFYQGFAPFVYFGETASQINRIKNGNRILPRYFGEKMANYFLQKVDFETEILIIPVPMTKEKLEQRGYNQAHDLAIEVAKVFEEQNKPYFLDFEILQKIRETQPQKHLTLRQRYENSEGVYHVRKRTAVKDKIILLIDDIMTTGATGSACAKALYGAGASRVYLLTACSLPEQK